MSTFDGSHRNRAPGTAYAAGVAASLLAEGVFILMVMGVRLLRGKEPWTVTRVPASFLLGPDAVRPPGFVPGDVLLGMMMHLWLSILIGVIYAALLPRFRLTPLAGGLVTAGVLYALGCPRSHQWWRGAQIDAVRRPGFAAGCLLTEGLVWM